jgi:hypothetical protein
MRLIGWVIRGHAKGSRKMDTESDESRR